MPITARLSRRFYDKFGDDIVNELVEWFNQVDLAYRSELDRVNEANFVRFEAKLEQHLAELGAQLRGEMAGMRSDIKNEMVAMKGEMGTMKSTMALKSDLDALRVQIQANKADTIKWMFVFWATTLAGVLLK